MSSNVGKSEQLNTSLATRSIRGELFVTHDKAAYVRWLPNLLRSVAVILAALHTWAAITSNSMNPDGITYLDMGEAYLRGDWSMAINAYWSPFYAWLLGVAMQILDPPMRWEFPVVQLVNFLIYLGALGSFEFFWRQLMRLSNDHGVGKGNIVLPEWAWLALGYTLFIWSSLNLIEVWSVTPDMTVAIFVYFASGLILRIRCGAATWRTFALFGMVLGLGYLTKAVMFPLALVFLGIGLLSAGNIRRAVPLTLVALCFFVLIASPFVVALSQDKGRLTFGDSGKLNYARYVNGISHTHWQGEFDGNGDPIHPTRKIYDAPEIYEFATPIGGTYPPWYDPSYWYEGVALHFDLKEQVGVLFSNILFYLDFFFRQQGGLLIGMLILYGMGNQQPFLENNVARQWGLLLLALVVFLMYGLVYIETRYFGAFVTLFWADLLVNLHLHDSQLSRRLLSLVSIAMILFLLINILNFNLEGLRSVMGWGKPHQIDASQAQAPSWPGEVAQELHALGVQPGDKVAIIGYGFDAYWARLARVQIVAEMLGWQADDFWLADSTLESEVLQAFASTGAKAIVAENVPDYASLAGWYRVGESNYYIYILGS